MISGGARVAEAPADRRGSSGASGAWSGCRTYRTVQASRVWSIFAVGQRVGRRDGIDVEFGRGLGGLCGESRGTAHGLRVEVPDTGAVFLRFLRYQ